jgi:hypothetical protein
MAEMETFSGSSFGTAVFTVGSRAIYFMHRERGSGRAIRKK